MRESRSVLRSVLRNHSGLDPLVNKGPANPSADTSLKSGSVFPFQGLRWVRGGTGRSNVGGVLRGRPSLPRCKCLGVGVTTVLEVTEDRERKNPPSGRVDSGGVGSHWSAVGDRWDFPTVSWRRALVDRDISRPLPRRDHLKEKRRKGKGWKRSV